MTTFNERKRVEAAVQLLDADLTFPDQPHESVREFYRVEWLDAVADTPAEYVSAFIDSLMEEARELNAAFRNLMPVKAEPRRPTAAEAAEALSGAGLSRDRLKKAVGNRPKIFVVPDDHGNVTPLNRYVKPSRGYVECLSTNFDDLCADAMGQESHFAYGQLTMDFGSSRDDDYSQSAQHLLGPAHPFFAHSVAPSKVQAQQSAQDLSDGQPVIRVMGIGGAGCNIVNRIYEIGAGIESIAVNTDRDHLDRCLPPLRLQLGARLTRGLGAGSNPEVGRKAAEEDRDVIRELLVGTDLLFVAAGMGGGTGSGASPVVAKIARELGILTIAVVTRPFLHEGKKRISIANRYIHELQQHADALILIKNDKLLRSGSCRVTVKDGFKLVDNVLNNAVRGISDLITRPGMMNLDFADVRTVLARRGQAIVGLGVGCGPDRARKAVEAAFSNALTSGFEAFSASGILVNISCDDSLTLGELELINAEVNKIAAPDVDMKCGTTFDPALRGELRVAIVAAGIGRRDSASHIATRGRYSFTGPLKSAGYMEPRVYSRALDSQPSQKCWSAEDVGCLSSSTPSAATESHCILRVKGE